MSATALAVFALAAALAFNGYIQYINPVCVAGEVKRSTYYSGFFNKFGFDSKDFREVSKDEVQTYWDAKPCNSGWKFGDEAPFGTRAFFDEVARKKYKVEYHIPAFADFENVKGKKILEVGGGMCTTAVSFVQHGADLSVIDLSPKSMELCKKRFDVYDLKANFFVGDAEHLTNYVPIPKEEEKFDLVWSFGVIHHSPFPDQSLLQIRNYLKPSGELKLMLYTKVSFKLFWIMNHTNHWDLSKMDEIVAHYSEAVEGSPVTYTYTNSEARALLESTGFEITDMYKAHIFPYDISKYKQNEFVREDIWKKVDHHRFLDLEEELGWHLCITAKLKEGWVNPNPQVTAK